MSVGTWNVQDLKQKTNIISEIEELGLDIVALTETKKKGTGTNIAGEYVHSFSGVSKEKRAARGVSLLIKKKLQNKISNWEAIENMLKVNIKIGGHNITVVAAYTPSDDEKDETKQSSFEKNGGSPNRNRE